MANEQIITGSGRKVQQVEIMGGGASDGAIVDGVSSSLKATVKDLTNSNPLTTAIVDGNGDQITSFGGGTQYTEGDTDASITGTALLFEGAANTLVAAPGTAANGLDVDVTRVTGTVTVDGSGVTQPVSNAGLTELAAAINSNKVDVNIVSSDVASGGTAAADDADFTATTTLGTPAMGVYESTPTNVTDGDMGVVGITTGRRLKTSSTIDAALPAGTNAIGKLAANDGVDIGDVTINNATIAVTQSGTWDEIGINDSGNSITVDNAQLSVVGSGTEAAAMRVTIATDSTGVLSIDDNGGNISIDDGGNVITVDGTVGVTGVSTLTEQQTQTTSLQLIDDIVYVDDTATHSTGSSKGALFMAAATPTDSSVNANDIGAVAMTTDRKLHVAVMDALPAGTAAIGKLASNDGVDIGNVDVASIAAGDNNIGNVDIVTVPTDPFGATADAAVTAGATGSISAKLRSISRDLVANIVLATGSNAIGKLAANSGIDIGDVDVTSVVPGSGATNLGKAEDAGHTTGDVGVMALGVRTDVPNAVGAGTTADYSFLATDMAGGVRTALYETDFAVLGTNHVKKYYTNSGAVTDGIVWSPAAGKRWYVTDIFINTSAAATITLEDDLVAGDSVVWKAELAANSGWSHHYGTPLFSGEDAADLLVTTSAGNVYITITGYEI